MSDSTIFVPDVANVPMRAYRVGGVSASRLDYRSLLVADSPYTFNPATDCVLGINTVGGAITVQFPSNAPAGTLLVTTDVGGNCAVNACLGLRPSGGTVQGTSGAGTFNILTTNRASIVWICDGNNNWFAMAQF